MSRATTERATALTLPSLDDISRAYAFESDRKRIQRLLEHVDAGRPVWWHRERFHKEPFREVDPKWHVLESRVRGDVEDDMARWDFTWRAACGYTRVRSELLFGALSFSATTPRRTARCEKCQVLYAGYLAARRRA